jgi:outer membrane protein insertion porin family
MTRCWRTSILTGLGTLLVLGVAGVTTTDWAGAILLDRVAASLRERYSLILRSDRVELHALSLSGTLHGLTLATVADAHRPFVRVERVEVDLSARSIVGRWIFDRIVVARPVVSLDLSRSYFADVPSGSANAPAVEIRVFEVQDVDLSAAGASNARILVRGLSGIVRRAGNTLAADIAVGGGVQVDAPPLHVAFERADVHASVHDGVVDITSADATSPSMSLRCAGAVGIGDHDTIDLRYESTMALDDRRVLEGLSALGGRIGVRGNITGTRANPVATFQLDGADLEWAALQHGGLRASGRLSKTALTLDSSSLSSARGSIQARGNWIFAGGEPSHVTAEWSIPSLRAWVSRMVLDVATGDMSASGASEWTWHGFPTGDSVVVTGRGGIEASVAGGPAVEVHVDGRGGRLTVRADSRLPGETTTAVEVSTQLDWSALSSSAIAGRVDVQSADVRQAAGQLRAMGFHIPLEVDSVSQGVVALQASIGGTIAAPTLHATLDGTAGSTAADHTQVHAVLSASSGGATIDSLTLRTRDGRLDAAGRVDLLTQTTTGAFEVRLDRLDGASARLPQWPIAGSVSIAGAWSGTLRAPMATARMSGVDFSVGGIPFDRVTGDLEATPQRMRVRDLQFTQPHGSLRVDGEADLAARRFSLVVDARDLARLPDDVAPEETAAPAASPLRALPAVTDVSLQADVAGWFGDSDHPATSVIVNIAHVDARVLGRTLALANPVTASYDGTATTLSGPAKLTFGGATMVAEGSWGGTASAGLSLAFDGRMDDLLPLVQAPGAEASWAGEGSVNVHATVTGTLEQPVISGDASLSIESLRQRDREIARGLNVRAVLGREAIEFTQLAGRALGGVLEANGRVPLAWLFASSTSNDVRKVSTPPDPPAALAGTWRADVSDALTSLGVGAQGWGGRVQVSVEAIASEPRLDAIDATLTGEIERVTTRDVEVVARVPLTLRLKHGRLEMERVEWDGPENGASISGTVDFADGAQSDLRIRGHSRLRLADRFFPVRANGQTRFDLQVTGHPDAWNANGTISLADCSVLFPQRRVALAAWSGTLVLTPEKIEAEGLSGQLNGGPVDINGALWLRQRELVPELEIHARDIFVEPASGFRSQVDADLTVGGDGQPPRIAGVVSITADAYREPMTTIAATIADFTSPSPRDSMRLPAWLTDVPLDIRLNAMGPLVIENRVADVEFVPSLELAGSLGKPALVGRIDIVPDGRIQAAGRMYRLTDGVAEFSAANGVVPTLNVSGETQVGAYNVTLRVTGPADQFQTTLTSDPPLGDRDLRSLLLTGQTNDVLTGSQSDDQFVAGMISSDVLGFAGQFIGIDSIRVGADDFELVSDDVKPVRRLTVSKRLGSRFELLFSENLDDNELTWIIVYRPRAGYEFRMSSRENVEQGFEFRREMAFGAGAAAPTVGKRAKVARETIADVTITGQPGFPASDVLAVVKLEPGDGFEFSEWWRDRDRIEQLYLDRGYFSVRVVPSRTVVEEASRRIRLDYRIVRGPRTTLTVEGYEAPQALVELLHVTWSNTVTDFLSDALASATRRYLIQNGFLQPKIEVEITREESAAQHALIRIATGSAAVSRGMTFSGNSIITESELDDLVRPFADIDAWIDPASMLEAIESEYRARGYPSAQVRAGEPEFTGTAAILPVSIQEGPPTEVGTVRLVGVDPTREQEMTAVLALVPGAPVNPDGLRAAGLRLEREYLNRGFRDARATASIQIEPGQSAGDITVEVEEGPLYIVRALRIEGAHATRESVVRNVITLEPGAGAGQAAVAETERRLFGLGVFRGAAVTLEPALTPAANPSTVDVDAVVALQEARRYRLRFGIETSSEYQPAAEDRLNSAGFAADLRDTNFLGRAMSMGVGMRYEPSLYSVRTLFSVPRLGQRPVRTNVYGVWRREDDVVDASGRTFRDDTTEFTIEQRWQPRRSLDFAWGYNLDWRDLRLITEEQKALPRHFDGVLGSLFGTATIDRRDNPFDAKRGWFQSSSVQWGLQPLGSSVDYLRLLLRASYYRPLGALVLASTARVGTLVSWDGVPGPNVEDIFFKAGGTQSVRGYAQDALSAIEFDGIPLGGTRVAVLNQEIRFPMFWRLGGVVFADAGNTFASGGIVLSDLAVGLGFGVRIRTPLAPIRVDLGFPMPQPDGGLRARWHFSIGQMF